MLIGISAKTAHALAPACACEAPYGENPRG